MNLKYHLNNLLVDFKIFLDQIDFGPQNGDWSSAVVTIVIGFFALIGYTIKSYKSFKEGKEDRLESERLRINEQNEAFSENRKRFYNLEIELTKECKSILYKNYRDKAELLKAFNGDEKKVNYAKTIVFHILRHLSDIEFIYDNKENNRYWNEWVQTFHYIFSKKIFITAYRKHRKVFETNESFIILVDSIMSDQVSAITDKEKELVKEIIL